MKLSEANGKMMAEKSRKNRHESGVRKQIESAIMRKCMWIAGGVTGQY
jgi:hypothetical protein